MIKIFILIDGGTTKLFLMADLDIRGERESSQKNHCTINLPIIMTRTTRAMIPGMIQNFKYFDGFFQKECSFNSGGHVLFRG